MFRGLCRIVKVLVGDFNQERALSGAFSVILKTDGSCTALILGASRSWRRQEADWMSDWSVFSDPCPWPPPAPPAMGTYYELCGWTLVTGYTFKENIMKICQIDQTKSNLSGLEIHFHQNKEHLLHNVYPWQRGKTSRRRNGPRLIETPSHSSSKKQFVISYASKHALPMFYFLFIFGKLNTKADIKLQYDHAPGTCCSGSSFFG